ncbi:MAG: hypothetical protein K5786_06005 [Treponema sp.]|nr:hypothetical protein [Treponema sp.]
MIEDKSGDFEWTATFININEGHNDSLNKKCKPLYDYKRFVNRIKQNLKNGMEETQAISEAIDIAIEQELLEGFFKLHKAEVEKMCLTEFDRDLYEKNRKEESYNEGVMDKAIEAAKNLLKMKLGTPEQIAQAAGLPIEKVMELAKEVAAK